MPRFVFFGGPETGHAAQTVAYGTVFPLGVPQDVSDAFVVRKLRGNRFFREVHEAGSVDPPRRGRPRKERN